MHLNVYSKDLFVQLAFYYPMLQKRMEEGRKLLSAQRSAEGTHAGREDRPRLATPGGRLGAHANGERSPARRAGCGRSLLIGARAVLALRSWVCTVARGEKYWENNCMGAAGCWRAWALAAACLQARAWELQACSWAACDAYFWLL
jgi:hypothetical protein